MIDHTKLENLRGQHARCPACAAEGRDRAGNHLYIGEDGRYGCAVNPNDAEHRKQIHALVGISENKIKVKRRRPSAHPIPAPTPVEPVQREVMFPALRRPTCSELALIRVSRGWPVWSPLEYLAQAGMLFTATMKDGAETVDAWILTDPSRRVAQARRLDGKPWASIGAKAKTLPGSTASWPVGAALLPTNQHPIFLCEGGPDALAVQIAAWLAGKSVQVVAVLGAGNRLHRDALPLFRGRRVRIVEQNDGAALKAGARWARQLHEAGAKVDGWAPPSGVKDIADLVASFTPQDEDPIADLEDAAVSTGLFGGGL